MSAPRQQGGQGGRAVTLTDAQVIEIRALREFRGWTTQRIAERFPGEKRKTLQGLLEYRNRAKLVPTPADVPTDA